MQPELITLTAVYQTPTGFRQAVMVLDLTAVNCWDFAPPLFFLFALFLFPAFSKNPHMKLLYYN